MGRRSVLLLALNRVAGLEGWNVLRGGTQDQYGKQKSWQDLLLGSVGGTAAFNLPGGSMKRGRKSPTLSFFLHSWVHATSVLRPWSQPVPACTLPVQQGWPGQGHSRTSAFQCTGFLLSPLGSGCLETTLVSSGPPPPFFHLSHEEDLSHVVRSGLKCKRFLGRARGGGQPRRGWQCWVPQHSLINTPSPGA